MKESTYKTYDDLPLFLNAAMVAQVLGVSPASSYELMHEKDFPTLRVGTQRAVMIREKNKAASRLGARKKLLPRSE